MYVYIVTEPENSLYTVGFYDPGGKFVPESDWPNRKQASERVHYLNGGSKNDAEAIFIEAQIYDEAALQEAAVTRAIYTGLTRDDWNTIRKGPIDDISMLLDREAIPGTGLEVRV